MAALSPFYSYSGCWCWVWRESHTAQPFPGCTCCTSPRQMLGLLLVQNVCAVSLVYFWCVWGREWGDSGGWSETLPARVINEPSISWATRRGGRLGQLRVDGLKNFKKFERSHCIAMKKQNCASWLLYFKHIYISCHNRWHSFSQCHEATAKDHSRRSSCSSGHVWLAGDKEDLWNLTNSSL